MKLRIRTTTHVSDVEHMPVTGRDVVVEDADTGRPLHGVQSVSWECGGRTERPVCILTLRDVLVDLTVPLADAQAAHVRLLAQDD